MNAQRLAAAGVADLPTSALARAWDVSDNFVWLGMSSGDLHYDDVDNILVSSLSLTHTYTRTLSRSHTHTHTLCLSLTHTHTHSLSLALTACCLLLAACSHCLLLAACSHCLLSLLAACCRKVRYPGELPSSKLSFGCTRLRPLQIQVEGRKAVLLYPTDLTRCLDGSHWPRDKAFRQSFLHPYWSTHNPALISSAIVVHLEPGDAVLIPAGEHLEAAVMRVMPCRTVMIPIPCTAVMAMSCTAVMLAHRLACRGPGQSCRMHLALHPAQISCFLTELCPMSMHCATQVRTTRRLVAPATPSPSTVSSPATAPSPVRIFTGLWVRTRPTS